MQVAKEKFFRELIRERKEKRLKYLINNQSFIIYKCDPDRTQTCDLQNRNLPFYSTKLRDHFKDAKVE